MCYHVVDLYLHCSHITIRPIYCTPRSQIEAASGSNSAGGHATDQPRYQFSSNQSVSAIKQCPNSASPKTHSYLLCCPACRGRFLHTEYETDHDDWRTFDHDTKRKCVKSDTKSTTLSTCARLKMGEQSGATQPSASFTEQTAFAFPDGLGLNNNPQQAQQSSTQMNGPSASTLHLSVAESRFELRETYLRFPLTKCHHLVPFDMPETFLNESNDSILPCGCWTGKAPDSQIQQATLFVNYFGGDTSFKSVWDVTCLGPGGCWECGAREFEVSVSNGGDVGEGRNDSYTNGGHAAGGRKRRVNTQTGNVMSMQEAFVEDCQNWQKLEAWKDKWYSGDIAEWGGKLMAESRWAPTSGGG